MPLLIGFFIGRLLGQFLGFLISIAFSLIRILSIGIFALAKALFRAFVQLYGMICDAIDKHFEYRPDYPFRRI